MKFGKVGQVGLVLAIALLVATLFTACGTLTVAFMFVATTKQTPGQMEVYEINSESGALRTIPTSPFPSGGRNPIAEAVSPDFKNVYVVNQDDNNIVQFGIGTDGKLYPQSTVNTPGSFPLAVTINSAGTLLYVVDTIGPIAGCSLANPCPGDIAIYPINSNGSLGSPVINPANNSNYWPLQLTPSDIRTILTPTAINILANGSNVYVTAYNSATTTGYLFAYSANSDGTLSALNSGSPVPLGSHPAAITSDSTSQNVYIVDEAQNQVGSFSVQSNGTLNAVGTAAAGQQPVALTLFNDKFLYVANSLDSTVTAYSASSGNLTKIATYASSTNPIAITSDPRNLGFLYTVNFLGNSLSGYKINTSDGTLINTQQSPYLSSAQPTAISGVPHGGTATAAK